MIFILIFFAGHWLLSVFIQSFFLHRYSAHRMFEMNKVWERFFYFFSFIGQGSSYLNPRAYAIIHRIHHAYSDSEKDPVSPVISNGFFDMVNRTAIAFKGIASGSAEVERKFRGRYPEIVWFDRFADSWPVRIFFGGCYTLIYVKLVPIDMLWIYILLPIHYFMGPIQTAIVNWCGHKYGYKNHPKQPDHSKNTLPIDILILGELYQNNHHAHPNSPNFAYRWFEFDLTYQIIKLMHFFKIIRIRRAVWTERGRAVVSGTLLFPPSDIAKV
ncbi:stearoyl-CoA 9-desaturase [Leptospira fainei serovar Hurstbridge str. BUT 6]|uniref:Stearoyl-CoA 9-desaturase n=1 Tax=Leptospira fainei serovar Hurstbridge str. BUT 6 TaxID=1193011 RepID=S3V4E2_9LEPT|nr:fatty acid desaturase [Leptospira fainei]EPG76313.1 stearoyl-CoA 9-desaturase [Leptospira fainei serovar Hurstbridge str. BUT 6]